MSEPTTVQPWPEEYINELRSYHNPCGWSCAASVDHSECQTERWLATLVEARAGALDAEAERDVALSGMHQLERVIEARAGALDVEAALSVLDVIDGIVDDTHPEGDGCPLCTALDDLRAILAERQP